MDINFILANCTYIKYYIPLVQELSKRGINSIFFMVKSLKYNSPYNYLKQIKSLSSEYGFRLDDISNISKSKNANIMIEGNCANKINNGGLKISITSLTDFQISYKDYINLVDFVIFPSEFFANYYGAISRKNVYMGSPKYDVNFKKENILTKYKLNDGKKVLIIFPRNRDANLVDVHKIYNILRKMGYKIIVKSRSKDPVDNEMRGDYYFEDVSWFPHTTMELIEISDFVVNFGSTAIKECVMLDTPLMNFDVKPFKLPMDFMYNYKYCRNIYPKFKDNDFEDSVNYLISVDFSNEFAMARKNHLFERRGVSKKIIDFLLKKNEC